MKFIALIAAAGPGARAELQRRLLAQAPDAQACIVNLVDVQPGWPVDPAMGSLEQAPPYDAVLEWWSDAADGGGLLKAGFPGAAVVHRYRVSETSDKDSLEPSLLPTTPGIKLISPWSTYPGLEADWVRERWDRHARLVLDVQWGAARYRRDWVDEVLSADAPPYRGFTLLHFASEEDLVLRQYDSPEAAYAVLEDSAQFMADDLVLYASEHVRRS